MSENDAQEPLTTEKKNTFAEIVKNNKGKIAFVLAGLTIAGGVREEMLAVRPQPNSHEALVTMVTQQSNITGEQYAKLGKTDPQTAFGMRIAMADAVAKLKSEQIPDGQYKKFMLEAINTAVDNNPYIEAAGTGKIVKNYFNDVINTKSLFKIFLV